MHTDEWYYCLKHNAVEPYEACKRANRLGPYPTYAEAAQALEKVKQRNQTWEDDPRFAEDD